MNDLVMTNVQLYEFAPDVATRKQYASIVSRFARDDTVDPILRLKCAEVVQDTDVLFLIALDRKISYFARYNALRVMLSIGGCTESQCATMVDALMETNDDTEITSRQRLDALFCIISKASLEDDTQLETNMFVRLLEHYLKTDKNSPFDQLVALRQTLRRTINIGDIMTEFCTKHIVDRTSVIHPEVCNLLLFCGLGSHHMELNDLSKTVASGSYIIPCVEHALNAARRYSLSQDISVYRRQYMSTTCIFIESLLKAMTPFGIKLQRLLEIGYGLGPVFGSHGIAMRVFEETTRLNFVPGGALKDLLDHFLTNSI